MYQEEDRMHTITVVEQKRLIAWDVKIAIEPLLLGVTPLGLYSVNASKD